MPNDAPAYPPLALRPAAAARALGLSPRTLWQLTKAGDVPHAILSRSVYRDRKDKEHTREIIVYPVSLLTKWLEAQAQAAQPQGTNP